MSSYKKIIISTLLLLCLFILPRLSFANTFGQAVDSSNSSKCADGSMGSPACGTISNEIDSALQGLGKGLSGTATGFDFELSSSYGTNPTIVVQLVCFGSTTHALYSGYIGGGVKTGDSDCDRWNEISSNGVYNQAADYLAPGDVSYPHIYHFDISSATTSIFNFNPNYYYGLYYYSTSTTRTPMTGASISGNAATSTTYGAICSGSGGNYIDSMLSGHCNPNYWLGYPVATSYFLIYGTGSSFTPQGGTGTHIISFTPIATSTATTSPVYLSVTYNVDTDLGSSTPTLMFTLLDQDDGTYHEYHLGYINTTLGIHTMATTSGSINTGLYHYSIVFDGIPPTVNDATFGPQASSFVVGKTAFPQSSVDLYFPASTTPVTITSGLSDCDSLLTPSGVGCAVGTVMKNLFYILFVPDEYTLDRFREQYSVLSKKSPWGYIFLVVNDINGYNTATAASLSSANLAITLPSTGVFGTASSTSVLKGKTITFIDWTAMASSTTNNYWGSAWSSLNNFLNLMMGAGFFFWLFNFVIKRLHP